MIQQSHKKRLQTGMQLRRNSITEEKIQSGVRESFLEEVMFGLRVTGQQELRQGRGGRGGLSTKAGGRAEQGESPLSSCPISVGRKPTGNRGRNPP